MRTATFTNFGIDVTGKKTIDEVLQTAGLDYTVNTEPIYYPASLDDSKMCQVPGKLLTIKEETREPIAVVSAQAARESDKGDRKWENDIL